MDEIINGEEFGAAHRFYIRTGDEGRFFSSKILLLNFLWIEFFS
jgi:hypothetical protein